VRRRFEVLVVEDEAVISRVCAETLSGEGFEVDVATNGSIAKNMIEKSDEWG
jgi:DNA-binding response OmpR family regulator